MTDEKQEEKESLNLHRLRTRHLNKIKGTLIQTEENPEYGFKVSMHGKTGRMLKTQVSSQPSTRWIEATLKELKTMGEPSPEEVEPILDECFRKTIRYLYTEDQDELVEELMDKIENLDESYENINLYASLQSFAESFTELKVTTNLQQIETNPFLNIYDKDGEKIDSWRHGVETRLPEGKYEVECIAGEQTQTEKLELDSSEDIHFEFDVKKLKQQEKPQTRTRTKQGEKIKIGRAVKRKISSFSNFVKKLVITAYRTIKKIVKLGLLVAGLLTIYYLYNIYFAV